MRVILYARVSTDEQARSGLSIDAQADKLRAWAELFNHDVVSVITDAGESAKSLRRPGIREALGMLSCGVADGIVVAKLDRLTRNIADWQTLIADHFSEKAGKELFSLGDSIDTTTAGGRLVLNVLLSVAQWEREAIGERTRVALQHKLANNKRAGEVRYGWDLLDDGETLVPNEAEQTVIALIFKLHSGGTSLRGIARHLNECSIPTKKGNARWSHTTVASIIKRATPEPANG
jgi:DNA invertase Pin-like site-specific DNA recombinase